MRKIIDLTGQKFGRLTVLYRVESAKDGHSKWHCKCVCGNEVDVQSNNLKCGVTQSCGCYKKEISYKCNIESNEYNIINDYIVVKTSSGVVFFIDKDDEWVLKDYCWHVNGGGRIQSHMRGKNSEITVLHRLIMNCPEDMVVDHINGNPLDNRRCNLRIVTQQQNAMNHKIRLDNTSGTTGVCFNKRNKKWAAHINFNNESIHIGYFDNFEDAVAARKSAEEKYFGEYSYDNSRVNNQQEVACNA